jgi:hypothetical protein
VQRPVGSESRIESNQCLFWASAHMSVRFFCSSSAVLGTRPNTCTLLPLHRGPFSFSALSRISAYCSDRNENFLASVTCVPRFIAASSSIPRSRSRIPSPLILLTCLLLPCLFGISISFLAPVEVENKKEGKTKFIQGGFDPFLPRHAIMFTGQ